MTIFAFKFYEIIDQHFICEQIGASASAAAIKGVPCYQAPQLFLS